MIKVRNSCSTQISKELSSLGFDNWTHSYRRLWKWLRLIFHVLAPVFLLALGSVLVKGKDLYKLISKKYHFSQKSGILSYLVVCNTFCKERTKSLRESRKETKSTSQRGEVRRAGQVLYFCQKHIRVSSIFIKRVCFNRGRPSSTDTGSFARSSRSLDPRWVRVRTHQEKLTKGQSQG